MNAKHSARKKSSVPKKAESKCYSVWFDSDLHERLKVRAQSRGLSVSAHLRAIANEDIQNQKSRG